MPIAEVGTIKIDGVEIKSGENKTIEISENRREITITHKEENKAEFIYTITVNKSTTPMDIRLEVEDFKTSIVGSFKGYLTSSSVDDFSDYTVILKAKSNVTVGTIKANAEGKFAIIFNINPINNIIGYKYEVLDSKGNKVDEGNL